MSLNKIQSEFLGGISAIVVENNNQFSKLREFLGIKNTFLSDGTPASQLNLNITAPVAFYRDIVGLFIGYDKPEVVELNYALKRFNEAFAEQRSLFGDDNAPGIRIPEDDLISDPMKDEPIDAEIKEIKNELSLKEVLNQLTVGTVTPARCTGNLLDFKDKVIDVVKKKEKIVVTKENFAETKEVVTDLNSKTKVLKDQRAAFNKEIKRFTEPYSNAFSEIINALEGVSKSLNTNIKVFEDAERKALKQSIYDRTINPMLNMLCEKGMISKEIVKEFEFKDSWMNKTSFTKLGDHTKKVKDEMNAEFERLVNLYAQEKNDIATIESTVKQLSIAHHLDAGLRADTYIELYKKGATMPQVQERINQDIDMIKKSVEKAAEKQAQKIVSEQQNAQDNQQVENIQNVAEAKNVGVLSDEKTGEILARGDSQKLMALVAQTPEKHQGKTFEYTYTFSGSFGAIKTFSNILKLLTMIFKDFKYERIGK